MNGIARFFKFLFKKRLDKAYEMSVEMMIERGYDEDSVEQTEKDIVFHVDKREETGMQIETLDTKTRTMEEYLEDFIDLTIDKPLYTYDEDFPDPEFPKGEFEGHVGGGVYSIEPGRFVNISAIKNWVRTVKAESDRELIDVRDDTDKFNRLVDSTAFKVARKIYYVGRKPASTTPEEWDDQTVSMRPAEGTYAPGKEFWEEGFPYGAEYKYREGMH